MIARTATPRARNLLGKTKGPIYKATFEANKYSSNNIHKQQFMKDIKHEL